MTERILLIGAGAIGQAYGRHLQRGGAAISYLVKPKYADALRDGVSLYPLNELGRHRRDPVPFTGFEVVTDAATLADQPAFGQVWICVSATALRTGDWFERLAVHLGDATIVLLTPGLEDRAWMAERVAGERIVQGVSTLIGYQAPLPGEEVPVPGVAYWFPPLNKMPLSGADARVRPIVERLNDGRCPAQVVADAAAVGAFGSAVMMPYLVALELSGWSFAAVRRSEALALAWRATRQATAVVAAVRGQRRPLAAGVLRPAMIRMLSRMAPGIVPLDVETYLGYHFTKTGDQTRYMLERYVALGRQRDLPVDQIEALARQLGAHDAARPIVEDA